MNKLTNTIAVIFESIKHGVEYTGHFLIYVVTLGHYPLPRAKASDTSQPAPTPIAGRTATPSINQEEVTLLSSLSPQEKLAFSQSPQFQEYQKNPLNPFNSINSLYQEFRAKSFMTANHPGQNGPFFQSYEYNNYLKENPLNPFAVSIETAYNAYEARTNAMKAKRFEEDLEYFFSSLGKASKDLISGFRESPAFNDLLAKMKASSDYAISAVQDAYHEYKAAIEKAATDLQLKAHQELKEFTSKLEQSPFFNEFSKSPEYQKVALNPFAPIDQLKTALDDFRKRTFLEKLPANRRAEFEASSYYKDFIQNPFNSADNLLNAYQSFESQRLGDYLAKLKSQIGDKKFDEFTASDAIRNPDHPRTAEGAQAAYEQFKKAQGSWW